MEKSTQKFLSILLSIAILFCFPVSVQASTDSYAETFTGTYTAPETARNVLVSGSGASVSQWYGDRVNIAGHTYTVRQNEYGLNKDGNMIDAQLGQTYTIWLAQYGVASFKFTAQDSGTYSIFANKSDTYGHEPDYFELRSYSTFISELDGKTHYSLRSYQYGQYKYYNQTDSYGLVDLQAGETIYVTADATTEKDCVYNVLFEKYSTDNCHHKWATISYGIRNKFNCTRLDSEECILCGKKSLNKNVCHDMEYTYTPLGNDYYSVKCACSDCGLFADDWIQKHHYIYTEESNGCVVTEKSICEGCGDIDYTDSWTEHEWEYFCETTDTPCVYKEGYRCISCGEMDWEDTYTYHEESTFVSKEGCEAIYRCDKCNELYTVPSHNYSDDYISVTEGCYTYYGYRCEDCGYLDVWDEEENHNYAYKYENGYHIWYCTVCNEIFDSECDDDYDSARNELYTPVYSGSISLGETKTAVISSTSTKCVYTFVPAESGSYSFVSNTDVDTYVALYQNNELVCYDDDGGYDCNFCLTAELQAGVEYTLCVSFYSRYSTGSFDFSAVETASLNCSQIGHRFNNIWTFESFSDDCCCGTEYCESVCTVCGYTENYSYPCHCGGREYVQITPQHDNVCGTYNYACTECGRFYYDEPLTCHSNTDSKSICFNTKTCTRCGAQECFGGHSYGDVQTVAPSCTNDGYTYQVCSECLTTNVIASIPATGHNFGNNNPTCITCGIANPNYVAPQPEPQPAPQPQPAVTQPSTTTNSSSSSSKKVTVAKITLSSIKSKKKKQLTVTWKKNTKATGYQVQYSTDKKFKKGNKTITIKKNKTTSTTIKNLKSNKKYYVRVRAYKKVGNKTYYSSWSAVKNTKIK